MLKFQYVLKTVKKHVENFRIQVLKWSVPDAHPDSQVLSILKFSGIFENCMRGIFYSLKDTLLFKCSEFSKEVYTRCTSRWLSLEYSGIEIRQFTHSPEIKREIPFCTRKRSETYGFKARTGSQMKETPIGGLLWFLFFNKFDHWRKILIKSQSGNIFCLSCKN